MMFPWEKSYLKVKGGGLDEDDFQSERLSEPADPEASVVFACQHGRNFPSSRSIITFMVTTSLGIAIIIVVSLYSLSRAPVRQLASEALPGRVCGNSSAEARSLGCTFDQLTWAWLSPSCPRYASDKFLAADDFKYYSDPYNKVVVNDEEWELALNNQLPLYTERREHLSHCVYTFLSLAQIIRDGTQTHPKLSSYHHIEHCAMVVMESLKRDRDWYTLDADMGVVSYDEGC